MPIQSDPFWDAGGSSVRCSSDGENSDKYADPHQHVMEHSGRSIASLMPSGPRGLRAVVIPRSNHLGESTGFNAHTPRVVNIDPDIKGQSCVVDLSRIN